jgi:outer membrane protein TolC
MSRFRRGSCLAVFLAIFSLCFCNGLAAEPVPLKHIVELALGHSTMAVEAQASQQRAFAAYHATRNQYLPTLVIGSGLGATWGYPLSLEGSAPSIVNTTAQSAVLNPALRDFVREARTEWLSTAEQSKDQRDQVMQDAIVSYAELSKWEMLISRLSQDYARALEMEKKINERVQAGVDNPLGRNQARLNAARVYLHISQAQGAIDVLRNRLSQMTGLPAASIETIPDSIPALPEVKQDDDLSAKALQASPAIQLASLHATALGFHARGEHRSMLPTVDFAAQYALLATFNNYQHFFKQGSFQPNNASVGVVIRFPFFSPAQKARALAADADLLHAQKAAETARNQVSEQTLQLQRAVSQLSAAHEVASLEYEIAQSTLDSTEVRMDAGTASVHDEDDARTQASERYTALADADFELQRSRIFLLRATGELGSWIGVK